MSSSKGCKIYTYAELSALNSFIKQRNYLPETRPCRVSRNFYILRLPNGVDWMARKEDNKFRMMFSLTSWKRFNFGNKPLRAQQHRDAFKTYKRKYKKEDENADESTTSGRT